MEAIFDITAEELPIFLAETNEQLGLLDEGLVKLENLDSDPDLIQELFRAAHTLKGAAGMIRHLRMVDVTHALETALDGVRKKQIPATAQFIDLCLDAVDALRELAEEIESGQATELDIAPLLARFAGLKVESNAAQSSPRPASLAVKPGRKGKKRPEHRTPSDDHWYLQATISPESVASAARAFQLMLALQEMGEISSMDPDQATIETAAPVEKVTASFHSHESIDTIRAALALVDDIDELKIDHGLEAQELVPKGDAPEPTDPGPGESHRPLGEILIAHGLITPEQLETALAKQKQENAPAGVLGKALVQLGFVTQDVLDQVIEESKNGPEHESKTALHAEKKTRRNGLNTVRISVERLDSLLNLVGELITDRNRLTTVQSNLEQHIHHESIDSLSEITAHLGQVTDQLQEEVMGIRMLPISNVFSKFPRLVRDIARKANKSVELILTGEETELDRSVIEEIEDPLIHLLRNAIDHGLETASERSQKQKPERGTIVVGAYHEENRIIITVEDDGRGIDVERVKAKAVERGVISQNDASKLSAGEALNLIFAPGLSTAQKVTELSGRGVGMDIVKKNIERINGNVLIESWPEKGTRFKIILPLTLAIVPALLVRVNGSIFALPLVSVIETLRIKPSEVQTINGRQAILLRNKVLSLVRIAELFDMAHPVGSKHITLVVVQASETQIGLIVDQLLGEQELVVKPLGHPIGNIAGISSAAILGDGQIALIIDIQGLFKLIFRSH